MTITLLSPTVSHHLYIAVSTDDPTRAYDFNWDTIIDGIVGLESIGSGMGMGARDLEYAAPGIATVQNLAALRDELVEALPDLEFHVGYDAWAEDYTDGPLLTLSADGDPDEGRRRTISAMLTDDERSSLSEVLGSAETYADVAEEFGGAAAGAQEREFNSVLSRILESNL